MELIDWEIYRNKWEDFDIAHFLVPIETKEDLERLRDELEKRIISFRQESSKTKERRFHGEIQLSKSTKELIEVRRRLLKIRINWRRRGENDDLLRKLLNRMNRDIKRNIKRDVDSWESNEAKNLLEETDARKRWRKFQNISGKHTPTSISVLKREDGSEAWSDQERADTHALRLSASHSFPMKAYFNEFHKAEVDKELLDMEENLLPSFGITYKMISIWGKNWLRYY